MKTQVAASILAILGGATALLAPGTSSAGNVGYFKNEGSCPGYIGDPSAAITAAGHTPVALANLNAGSLAPLDGLVYNYFCAGNFVGNADVNNAVANGMDLFLNLHLSSGDTGAAANFPGAPAITVAYACSPATIDSDLAPGSPIATGTAGTLTNSSLDGSVYCSSSGYVSSGPLPGGFTPLLTSAGNTSAFSYTYGSGRVVIGLTQTQVALPGGLAPGHFPGTSLFFSNVVEWMLGGGGGTPTTCASEGYTGTKLLWCKNICEKGYTGATLDIWIHRWINRYRDLPYCAQEGGGEEEPPPQET